MCFSFGIGKDIGFQRGSKELSAGGGVLNSLTSFSNPSQKIQGGACHMATVATRVGATKTFTLPFLYIPAFPYISGRVGTRV